MASEHEPKPYVYIGSAMPGSHRVQQFVEIVRSTGAEVRVGELDMCTNDNVRVNRSQRDRLIAGSIGVLIDLAVPSFMVTGDRRYAEAEEKASYLLDLDPKSHAEGIKYFIETHQNGHKE